MLAANGRKRVDDASWITAVNEARATIAPAARAVLNLFRNTPVLLHAL